MFSVITNICNKKTKGPTLMELFTTTGKLVKKKFFFYNYRVRYVQHGWHGTYRYDIQVLATHASTWVHRYSSLLQWSVPLVQRGHVTNDEYPVFDISPEKKSQGVMSGALGGQSISGWSFPDANPVQRPGNTVFRYWRTSQWKWAGFSSDWSMPDDLWSVCFATVALATAATCPDMPCQ